VIIAISAGVTVAVGVTPLPVIAAAALGAGWVGQERRRQEDRCQGVP
jgi:hypothetical protein